MLKCELDECVFITTDDYLVGFTKTVYTVIEDDGRVEVCVNLTHPVGDIGTEQVLVEVIDNPDSGRIPTGATAASKMVLLLSKSR